MCVGGCVGRGECVRGSAEKFISKPRYSQKMTSKKGLILIYFIYLYV